MLLLEFHSNTLGGSAAAAGWRRSTRLVSRSYFV
eukprot:COSAG06_NODE_39930_length_407_cov_0.896104_1_plen_33_part_01